MNWEHKHIFQYLPRHHPQMFFSSLQKCVDALMLCAFTLYAFPPYCSTYYTLKNWSFVAFKDLLSFHSSHLITSTCENPNRSAKCELITLLVLWLKICKFEGLKPLVIHIIHIIYT